MPTFHDPVHDADAAREALRALAHATHAWDDPADTYPVLGSLVRGIRSLQQVLEQTAQAHLTHLAQAHDDLGDAGAGATSAQAAAEELHHASTALSEAEHRVNQALQHSARIAWHEPVQTQITSAERTTGWVDPLDLQVPPIPAPDGILPL